MKALVKKIFGKRILLVLRLIYSFLGNRSEFKQRKRFYRSFVKKNDLVFDIGANFGNRIGPILQLGAKIIAVEPQKECCDFLKVRFGKKIEILPYGLGEKDGIKEFYVSEANTLSSFSVDWIQKVREKRFKDYKWSKSILIQITTLDGIIGKFGVPDFVKIDVEGYELEVLKGLTRPLPLISFEYTVPECKSKIFDCIDQIEKYNSNVEYNFSAGESMGFNLISWCSSDQIRKIVDSDEFISSNFGDIYVRSTF